MLERGNHVNRQETNGPDNHRPSRDRRGFVFRSGPFFHKTPAQQPISGARRRGRFTPHLPVSPGAFHPEDPMKRDEGQISDYLIALAILIALIALS
jgi:hypothetical protein